MRIVQAGDHAAALQIDHFCSRPRLILLSVVHADDAAILDGEIASFGSFRIEGCNASVVEDEIGNSRCSHREVLCYSEFNQLCKSRVMSGMTTQVKSATTNALKTMLLRTKFQF